MGGEEIEDEDEGETWDNLMEFNKSWENYLCEDEEGNRSGLREFRGLVEKRVMIL